MGKLIVHIENSPYNIVRMSTATRKNITLFSMSRTLGTNGKLLHVPIIEALGPLSCEDTVYVVLECDVIINCVQKA